MRKALSIAFAVAALLAGAGTATADTTATTGAPAEASASAAACPVSGQRVKTSSSPAVYLVGPGRYLYWIPSPDVYNNLFRTWDGIATYNNLFVDCYASARTLSNGHLIKHPSHPHVYIWDGFLGHYRWIVSGPVFDKYQLAWNKIRTQTSGSWAEPHWYE